MFNTVTLRGGLRGRAATISAGYRTAAVVRDWRVRFDRTSGQRWFLKAKIESVNPVLMRQGDLLFAVPRPGGYLTWPLLAAPRLDGPMLSAALGPPEH